GENVGQRLAVAGQVREIGAGATLAPIAAGRAGAPALGRIAARLAVLAGAAGDRRERAAAPGAAVGREDRLARDRDHRRLDEAGSARAAAVATAGRDAGVRRHAAVAAAAAGVQHRAGADDALLAADEL